MAKSPERQKIEAAILAIYATDPDAIYSEVAQRVNLELGVSISSKQVGEIRRSLGIGSFQKLWDKMRANLAAPFDLPYNAEMNLKVIASAMAVGCVRLTVIEKYHDGTVPQSKTGDYSDVKVVTPYGDIPWTEVSRLNQREMKAFNVQVVNRLYTTLCFLLDPAFLPDREAFLHYLEYNYPDKWDDPKLDQNMISLFRQADDHNPLYDE